MKQTMLLITPELPYPLQSGGKIKTWNMIRAFAKHWDISLVCPLKGTDAKYLEEFKSRTPVASVHTDCVEVPRTGANLVKSYIKQQPLNLVRTYSSALADKVAELAWDVDLILVDHFEVFQFLPNNFFKSDDHPPVIYHAHNAYHQIWQRYACTLNNPLKRLVCYMEALRVKNYERKLCNQADLVFAAPNDIAVLKREGCDQDQFGLTLHLGAEIDADLPPLDVEHTSNKLCYAGLLSWEPNVQGLIWFLDEVWPRLISQIPDLRFDIAGKNPDPRLQQRVEDLAGVELVGFVDDLEDLYQGSRISVCPLQFGSGIKVKVAQSLARGIPTVTTSVGAEGLGVEHGKHLMLADSAEQTASAIMALLESDDLWANLALNSRALMQKRYTWDAVFRDMKRDIVSMMMRKTLSDLREHATELPGLVAR